MRNVVITTCTNRKRLEPAPHLIARSLPRGAPVEVAQAWFARLSMSEGPHSTAAELYCGRSIREAEKAAVAVDASLFVISAGLGMISAQADIPSYNLTLAPASDDSILRRIDGKASEWWEQVSARSPYVAETFDQGGLILAALPRPYLEMVAGEWAAWPAERVARLRLFCKGGPGHLPSSLHRSWMPYDERLDVLDGNHAGTRVDFAQRALGHFAKHFARRPANAVDHAHEVLECLAGHEVPERPNRERLSDHALLDLMAREWDAVGGRSGAMLMHLRRQLNVACEQGRFKDLFKRAAAARQGALL